MALGDAWRLFTRVERLLALEANHGQVIKDLRIEIGELSRRVTRLENREEIVAIDARSAARAGAADAMQGVILEIGGRLARVEVATGIVNQSGSTAGARRPRVGPGKPTKPK